MKIFDNANVAHNIISKIWYRSTRASIGKYSTLNQVKLSSISHMQPTTSAPTPFFMELCHWQQHFFFPFFFFKSSSLITALKNISLYFCIIINAMFALRKYYHVTCTKSTTFFLETQNQLSHKTCKLQISGKV